MIRRGGEGRGEKRKGEKEERRGERKKGGKKTSKIGSNDSVGVTAMEMDRRSLSSSGEGR